MAELKKNFDEVKTVYTKYYPDSPFFDTWIPREKFLDADFDNEGNFSIGREDDGIYGIALGPAPRVPENWKNFSIETRGLSSIPPIFKAVAEWDCYWSPTLKTQTIENSVATDEEIREFLNLHAPQSSVFPGNEEIQLWLALRDKGQLVAVAAICKWESGHYVVSSVATHTDRRGEGWGRKVMQATLESGQALGAEHLCLGVMHGNTSAQRLYASMGFTLMHNFTYCERR
jgi:ribosomal protein S18 acetylase RimI-like enzyme